MPCAFRIGRQISAEAQRGQDFPIEDAEDLDPAIDAVRIGIEMHIRQHGGACGDLGDGKCRAKKGDAPSPGLGQPFFQATDTESRFRNGAGPLPFAARGLTHEYGTDKTAEIGDGRPEGPIVVHPVFGRLGVKDIESQGFDPASFTEADDGAVNLPGPGPGQAVFLASPIQAVLIEQDELDLLRGLARFGQKPDPPIPGSRLPVVEPTWRPEDQGHRKPDQGGQEPLKQFFDCRREGVYDVLINHGKSIESGTAS